MKIENKPRVIKNSAENIFRYVSNFHNFENLLPNQVENWTCTGDSCAFSVKGFFHLGLEIKEKEPYSSITIGEGHDVKPPFPFRLYLNFNEQAEKQTDIKILFDVDVNPMVAMIAKKPLQNLVDLMVERLDEMMG